MFTIKAKIRKKLSSKANSLRKEGLLPAILYGPKLKNIPLEISLKEFEKIEKKIGESSLLRLTIEDKKKSYQVLIKEIQREPISGRPIHVDFYQPLLKEKIEAKVPLNFKGEAPAIKLGGTLVKTIQEIEVKSLPQNLPEEIEVDIGKLKTFEDAIFVSDLKLPKGVEIMRSKDDIIARVLPPEKQEELKEAKEELEKKEEKMEEKKEG